MSKKIGFIGSGNMASAIIGGIYNSKLVASNDVMVSDALVEKIESVKEKYGVNITSDNRLVVEFSDILVLAVKPDGFQVVINEIRQYVRKDTVIVSIAAGISIGKLEEYFAKEVKIIRVMPNTAAMVQESMSAVCGNQLCSMEDLYFVLSIFNSFGRAELVEEKLMDVIGAVSGSSPAFVSMFIEALADGGVIGGMPRDKAYRFAAQAVLGAAKMVLETDNHPGTLKDMVCSPGGSTIEGVYALEKSNFRGSVIDAIKECIKKTQELSK